MTSRVLRAACSKTAFDHERQLSAIDDFLKSPRRSAAGPRLHASAVEAMPTLELRQHVARALDRPGDQLREEGDIREE